MNIGIVVRVESKDYFVLIENKDKIIRCSLRGKFKKEFNLKKDKLFKTDLAVVGDFIEFEYNKDGTGVINKILERKNYLSRKAPKIKGASYRGERLEQTFASNIDNLFVVSSVIKPVFNNKVIDRFLVSGESSNINSGIILNKSDLDEKNKLNPWIELYEKIGYKVFVTSAKMNEGIEILKSEIQGKKNLFWGQSGVGKSSLLNKIYPGIKLETGEISNYTNKGTHTTVTVNMIKVEKDTFIIDTPGLREIDPYGIRKEDVGHYFIEFAEYSHDCKFNTCTHFHEPGCAVIEAVEKGKISEARYDSYLRILGTIEEDIIF